MSNKLDKFEQMMKDNIQETEYSFDSAQWDKLQKRLDGKSGIPFWIKGIVAASIGAVVIFGSTAIYNSYNKEEVIAKTSKTEKTTIANDQSLIQKENNIEPIVAAIIEKEEIAINNNDNSSKKEGEVIIANEEKNNSTNLIEEVKNQPEIIKEVESVVIDKEEKQNIVSEKEKVIAPAPFFEVSSTEICAGEIIEFTLIDKSIEGDYTWDFGNGKNSINAEPKHTFEKPGDYIIKVETRAKSNNSIIRKSEGVLISVKANPTIDFTYETADYKARPTTQLINKTDNATDWTWDLGNGVSTSNKNPQLIYKNKGIYDVTLYAKNENGCTSSHTESVNIEEDYNLLAPNAFTPNGDPTNNNWFPRALDVLDYSFTMNIYSKNGKLVYSTKHKNPWDGQDQNSGEICQEGFYIWHVLLTNENGEKEEYQGHIYLTRP